MEGSSDAEYCVRTQGGREGGKASREEEKTDVAFWFVHSHTLCREKYLNSKEQVYLMGSAQQSKMSCAGL